MTTVCKKPACANLEVIALASVVQWQLMLKNVIEWEYQYIGERMGSVVLTVAIPAAIHTATILTTTCHKLAMTPILLVIRMNAVAGVLLLRAVAVLLGNLMMGKAARIYLLLM